MTSNTLVTVTIMSITALE